MNTDRRSWILSVLSALPLMKFLKPQPVCMQWIWNDVTKHWEYCEGRYCYLNPPCSSTTNITTTTTRLLGEANIIDTSWAHNSADIPADCLKIHQEYMKQIGQPYA